MLEQATIAHPGNKLLLAAYGRALADNGNFQQAFDVLGRFAASSRPTSASERLRLIMVLRGLSGALLGPASA